MRTYVVALTLLLALTACGSADSPEPAGTTTSGAWQRASAPPLPPRADPFVAWTGDELIVVGGSTGFICPPNADCASPDPRDFLSDGAAWDPATDTWRGIAPAPTGLWSGWGHGLAETAVLDGLLVLLDRQQDVWLSYDVATDRWSSLDPPGPGFADLSQHDGRRIWGLRRGAVVSWDPRTGDVRTERTYDETPTLDDQHLVLTAAGPVVTGVRYDDPAPDEPTLAQADLPDGDGWKRVVTGQIGWLYAEVAGQVVGAEAGGADGGEVDNWGRWYPSAGMLDPATGEWRPLDVPERTWRSLDEWRPEAFGDTEVVAGGQYRDLGTPGSEWVRVGQPDTGLSGNDLTSTWTDDGLAVVASTTGNGSRYQLAPLELWLWRPPAG